MAQSKKRGGKKAHNKRVKLRNEKIKSEQKKMKELYSKMFTQKLEELQGKFSGNSETDQVDLNQFAENLKVELPKPVSNQE
jgi:hypothetical protein